ncbi:translation elongation factor Ts [Sedimenticola selenatireducens]|uniref:Elongation factor Ts n=1 Tax=Sedimenticola selenatireducens TaxID=191960 RepID=A0A2N6CWN5_9GAMM|nr:translation elongation factor Ts [Sedimenticola selenatireducens]PLX61697.1 MAG: elongation factor Ts [Sedimenticola selenatireducens]
MSITASLVKELRERTGSGMMECKKALVETNGDIDAAIENMRKSGQAKAAKKAGRTAADGLIVIQMTDNNKKGVMVEVNCETDFVAKDENFTSFANAVAQRALASEVATVEELLNAPLHDGEETTVNTAREALIVKIGENMNVRRFERFESANGRLASYSHGSRIGVVVDIEGGDDDLAKDIAMHVAASNPTCVSEEQVPAELVEKEREIFKVQALESGKPENIVDKIVDGRVRKYLSEITLLGQAFIKDPDTTVEKLLAGVGATVNGFKRFEVGEGIEKKQENFADEVMAQVRGE